MAALFATRRNSGVAIFDTELGSGASGTDVIPGVGALVLTGYAPTVALSANQAVIPGAAALTLAGFAPAVALSNNRAATPGAGALVLAGFAPGIDQSRSATPGVGALVLTGYAPNVFIGNAQSVSPTNAALVLAGPAPTLVQTAHQGVTPGAGPIIVTGLAPDVLGTAHQAVNPGAGPIIVTGLAPTIAQAPPIVVAPLPGALTLTGFAPFIFQLPVPNETGIVVWDTNQYVAFIGAFPEFSAVPFPRTQALFSLAECTLLDNTPGSPVVDICYRTHLFYLLMGHLLLLLGSSPTTPDNTPPGRLSTATEGTITAGFEYLIPAGSMSAPWYLQTKYGALYWTATVRFRSLRYVANGSSGIGFAQAYGAAPVNVPGGL